MGIKKKYSVRLDLDRFDFPDVHFESCYVEILVDPAEQLRKGDLCFAPRLNRVMRSNENLTTPLHKVVSVNCPPDLAIKRMPDFLFMQCKFPNLIA